MTTLGLLLMAVSTAWVYQRRSPTSLAMSPSRQRTSSPAADHVAEHIARHDPARVLAECEAKRRIVALHGPNGNGMTPGGDMCSEFEPYPCDTIRALALPYADHEDFDESWKP